MVGIGYRYGICYLCIMLVCVIYYLYVVKSTCVAADEGRGFAYTIETLIVLGRTMIEVGILVFV